ncbi:uracil-DNA glycosylase [Marasmius fiardii PR-910]|nr:uracil-DNA glycosylase [Marasmius fiardii PR-910]
MPKHVSDDSDNQESTMIRTKVTRRTVTSQSKTSHRISTTEVVTTGEISSAQVEHLNAITAAQLASLELDTMGKCWYNALKGEFEKDYFKKLKRFLEEEMKFYTIFPPLKDVYSWSRLTSLDSVKVVILGQDPYHDSGQAHGLSFSVLPPTKVPGSLRNIYKQIAADVPAFVIPKTSGDLTKLAELGVLWLNTALTVRAHKAGSHSGKGWESVTAGALKAVMTRKSSKGVVFMAWGLPAQKTCEKLGIDESKHLVLKSAHPSPLSAHRGFFGNEHFKLTNEWLCEKYGEGAGIDWTVLCKT